MDVGEGVSRMLTGPSVSCIGMCSTPAGHYGCGGGLFKDTLGDFVCLGNYLSKLDQYIMVIISNYSAKIHILLIKILCEYLKFRYLCLCVLFVVIKSIRLLSG